MAANKKISNAVKILAAAGIALLLFCGPSSTELDDGDVTTGPDTGGITDPDDGGTTGSHNEAITNLPNRPLTQDELNAWTAHYNAAGGASAFELEVIRLINAERTTRGGTALTIDPALMMATRFKSQNMANLGYFSHTSPIYATNPNDYSPGIIAQMFGGPRTPSENIAQSGNATPESIITMWMNSEGHRNNILNTNSRTIGAGAYSVETVSGNRTRTNTFVTTNFGR